MSSFPRLGLLATGFGSALLLAACNSQSTSTSSSMSTTPAADSASTRSVTTKATTQVVATDAPFGQAPDGTEVQLFTLTNAQGAKATISTYGGTLTSLEVPDKNGKLSNVVLGFDKLEGYLSPAFRKSNPYFGALIGRYGNRIAKGKFTVDGKPYQVGLNNNGNSLHGGKVGFDQKVWTAKVSASAVTTEPTLTLRYLSKDGEEGYPGNLQVTVMYTLTSDNALKIDYTAVTDKATPLNLTNHAYFNLALGQSKDVLAHQVTIPADRYTVVDAQLIPTGELRPVKGTPFDFTASHAIGERIGQVPGGYDHNWVLNQASGQHVAATVYEPTTGRTMQVTTDQPGVQFYTGNFLDGTLTGHGGTTYGKHAGFCLETQHFPDSPNQPKFPSTILKPGETYHTTTTYTFGVRK